MYFNTPKQLSISLSFPFSFVIPTKVGIQECVKDKKKRSIPVSTGMTNKETGMTKDGLNKFGTKDNLKEKAGHIADAQEIILIDKLINWSIRELVNISK